MRKQKPHPESKPERLGEKRLVALTRLNSKKGFGETVSPLPRATPYGSAPFLRGNPVSITLCSSGQGILANVQKLKSNFLHPQVREPLEAVVEEKSKTLTNWTTEGRARILGSGSDMHRTR